MRKIYVGLDVGKLQIHYAFANREGCFENSSEGIASFLAQLAPEHHCVLEATGLYHYPLAYALQEAGQAFTVLNPLVSHAFGQSFLSISKTDPSDAVLLARLGKERQLAPTQLPCLSVQAFRHRLLTWQNLQQDLRRLENRLEALAFHPQPDPLSQAMMEEELSLLKTHYAQIEAALLQDLPSEYEEQVALASSIKGIGKKTALFLLLFTQGLQQFDSPKALSKYIGIAPTVYQSGKLRKKGRIAKKGNAQLRSLLYNCARSAKRFNIDCKETYERLRQKGKPHKVVMVAVMNKLVRQFFAVVKNKTPFINGYHMDKKPNIIGQ